MGINSYTVVNLLEAAAAKNYVVVGPVNLTTGVPVRLNATPLLVTQVEIYGYLSIGANTIPVPNAGPCWVTADAAGLSALEPLPAGGRILYKPPGGTSFDLFNLNVLGTTGDKVYFKYLA